MVEIQITAQDVLKQRELLGCGLVDAKRLALREVLNKHIDEASTLDDLKAVLHWAVRELTQL